MKKSRAAHRKAKSESFTWVTPESALACSDAFKKQSNYCSLAAIIIMVILGAIELLTNPSGTFNSYVLMLAIVMLSACLWFLNGALAEARIAAAMLMSRKTQHDTEATATTDAQ